MNTQTYLTKSELQVMLILWALPAKGGFTKDILANFEEPKPAYTTVSTFLKILTQKGFVKSIKEGAMLYHLPLISKEEYSKLVIAKNQKDFFDNDPSQFIQFIAQNSDLTDEQKQRIAEAVK